ncbi:Transposase DDE domain-containing protein [Belnapia rosea]|nr:Transposase DDE domain-containing protein [Belnapia rosea]
MRGRRKRGAHRQGLGRSRGGFTTKLHADTNADGWPLGLLITPGETHDAKVAVELADSVPQRPLVRLGDKGYDTDDIRYADWCRGTRSMIPTKSSRKTQFTVDYALYSLRNRIERYFKCPPRRNPIRQDGHQLHGFRRDHLNPVLAQVCQRSLDV